MNRSKLSAISCTLLCCWVAVCAHASDYRMLESLSVAPGASAHWQTQCDASEPVTDSISVLAQINACLWLARLSTLDAPFALQVIARGNRLNERMAPETSKKAKAESYRLEGDMLMLEMGLRSWFFQFKNGARLLSLAREAHALDPTNPHAKLLLAQVLQNTPKFAGGDTQVAAQWFQQLQQHALMDIRYYAHFYPCLHETNEKHQCQQLALANLASF